MEKTTEINSLPQSENSNNESNDLVNNIINEIKNNEENVQLNIQDNNDLQQPPMYNPNIPQQYIPTQNEIESKIPTMVNNNQNDDLITKLTNNLKNPIVVFFILLVMLLPLFDKYLSKMIPKLYINNNSLSYLGVLVKSILGSLIFYLSTLI